MIKRLLRWFRIYEEIDLETWKKLGFVSPYEIVQGSIWDRLSELGYKRVIYLKILQ